MNKFKVIIQGQQTVEAGPFDTPQEAWVYVHTQLANVYGREDMALLAYRMVEEVEREGQVGPRTLAADGNLFTVAPAEGSDAAFTLRFGTDIPAFDDPVAARAEVARVLRAAAAEIDRWRPSRFARMAGTIRSQGRVIGEWLWSEEDRAREEVAA